jgi:septin family protein
VQETPGLKGDAAMCAEILAKTIEDQQGLFAAAERNVSQPRGELVDRRVDAVLYFLPINARMSESDFDLTVIKRLAQLVPVIPVMCKVRCLRFVSSHWHLPLRSLRVLPGRCSSATRSFVCAHAP